MEGVRVQYPVRRDPFTDSDRTFFFISWLSNPHYAMHENESLQTLLLVRVWHFAGLSKL